MMCCPCTVQVVLKTARKVLKVKVGVLKTEGMFDDFVCCVRDVQTDEQRKT